MISSIKEIKGKALPMIGDDIDTDRIIPARFLRCVTFDGLGKEAFKDERFDTNGKPTDHPMNNPAYDGAKIMLSGNNFGCGSSREHAPQAIKRAGYDAIIAESFAEIFYGNSSVLGLVCVTLPKEELNTLAKHIESNPNDEVTINIEKAEVSVGSLSYKIGIKPTLQKSLIDGTYDTILELSKNKEEVEKLDSNLPPKCFYK